MAKVHRVQAELEASRGQVAALRSELDERGSGGGDAVAVQSLGDLLDEDDEEAVAES